MKQLLSLALLAVLTACGGGGGSSEPVAQPAAATCSPRVVTIQINGDSTNYGETRNTESSPAYRVVAHPEYILQREMDRAFGAGAVKVTTAAIPGGMASNLLAGDSGLFEGMAYQKWPAGIEAVDIVLIDFGANEWINKVDPERFKANLRTLAASRKVVLETPLPYRGDAGYAQHVRDVAAETGAQVIDLSAWALALPSWPQYVGDGLHPLNDGYELVTRQVVAPPLVKLVAAMRCTKG